MTPEQKAKRLLLEIVERLPLYTLCPKQYGPGKFIDKMSQENKDILKNLRSDDLKNVRIN